MADLNDKYYSQIFIFILIKSLAANTPRLSPSIRKRYLISQNAIAVKK